MRRPPRPRARPNREGGLDERPPSSAPSAPIRMESAGRSDEGATQDEGKSERRGCAALRPAGSAQASPRSVRARARPPTVGPRPGCVPTRRARELVAPPPCSGDPARGREPHAVLPERGSPRSKARRILRTPLRQAKPPAGVARDSRVLGDGPRRRRPASPSRWGIWRPPRPDGVPGGGRVAATRPPARPTGPIGTGRGANAQSDGPLPPKRGFLSNGALETTTERAARCPVPRERAGAGHAPRPHRAGSSPGPTRAGAPPGLRHDSRAPHPRLRPPR